MRWMTGCRLGWMGWRLRPCTGTRSPKALREELGTVKLTSLTAGAVQKALANLATRRSTRTVQMAHNVLVRAIRHAERDDLGSGTSPPRGAAVSGRLVLRDL